MKIEQKYQIEKASSKDETRTGLFNVKVSKRHAVASNGFILAVVPVEFEEGDVEGWLTEEAIKKARKLAKTRGVPSIKLNGSQELIDGSSLSRPSLEDATFPPVAKIIRDAEKNNTFRVGINAKELSKLAEALGTENVELVFSGSNKKAIFVRGWDVNGKLPSYGVLMPRKVDY